MIKIVKGDILSSGCEAIVNPVNCVGVMGKGLAALVKNAYPLVYLQYRDNCSRKLVRPGKILVTPTYNTSGIFPNYIFNFPTKRHWKNKSLIQDIELGLNDLLNCINKYEISSIAIPSLGCGNGGLDWNVVKPLIINIIKIVADDVNVLVYEPLN